MKLKAITRIGLISGIILFGLLVIPVCASDDNSWPSADSLDNILAWAKMNTPALPTVLPDNSGTFSPVTEPSNTTDIDNSWFTPASQDNIIAWGKMIAKQTAGITLPSTFNQAERTRIFKTYNTSGYLSTLPAVTPTSVPATLPGPSYAQKPITMPATPYYMASTKVMAVPTLVPTSGSEVSGQKTGISLTELNLQGNYVRITNTGTTTVVMTGWKITDQQGKALTFIDFPMGGGSTFTYVLNPYSTLTVFFGREGIVTGSELYYPQGTDFWNPLGDTASLYDPQGQLAGRISA